MKDASISNGPHDRVVEILSSGYARIKALNPLLSVRALAARLEVSPSYLSKVLRGERQPSARFLSSLAKVLQLDHHELAELQRLILQRVEQTQFAATTGIQTLSEKNSNAVSQYKSLDKGDFWLLENWHHIAILNLLTNFDAEFSADWIARRLGITVSETEKSLKRLIAGGYVFRDETGKLKRTENKIRFPTGKSHSSIRAYHRRMIEMAKQLLERAPSDEEFNQRLISGISFAADPERIAEAKLILEDAIYKAVALLSEGEQTSEVYHLNLQLFKVTRGRQQS